MTTSTTTQSDVITAAMGLAKDVAEGRVAPADLERQAIAEMRDLFGEVVGTDHPAWAVQADVARQAIALGALTADELAEWTAVMRRRAGERFGEPDPGEAVPEPVSIATKADSRESDSTEPELDPDDDLADVPDEMLAAAEVAPSPAVPLRPKWRGYDPLRGWNPGSKYRSASDPST